MDIISLFEQLAYTTHHQSEINHIINTLPIEVKAAFIEHDSQQIRKKISGLCYFPDAKTVTHR